LDVSLKFSVLLIISLMFNISFIEKGKKTKRDRERHVKIEFVASQIFVSTFDVSVMIISRT